MSRKLGLGSRGVIRRGAPADLLLFEMGEAEVYPESLNLSELKIILYNGEVVFKDGSFLKQPEGQLLRQ
jgi:imidazolonepropionase-like amidohydrolase